MKKNVMLRTASGLLVATLLSTSVVSGTFAKYVTSDSASDKARVAKFGVVVSAEGTIFSDTYKETTSNTPGKKGDYVDINKSADALGNYSRLSVISSSAVSSTDTTAAHDGVDGTDKVVAPGTKSNDNGLTLSVAGQPEVAVEVNLSVTGSDVWLGAGTYPNMTNGKVYDGTYDTDDWFEVNEAYYPIKYTLTRTYTKDSKVEKESIATNVTLYQLSTILKDYTKKYSAGSNLSNEIGTFNLTWEWVYDATTTNGSGTTFYGVYDKHDTLLGDLAADSALVSSAVAAVSEATTQATKSGDAAYVYPSMPATIASNKITAPTGTSDKNKYNLNTDVNITITVKQVD